MKKLNTATTRTIFTALCLAFIFPAWSQQNVIADKDNPRPELKASTRLSPYITYISAQKWSGYNEIKWVAARENDTRKYIIEFSTDGVNYQAAGEKLASNNLDYEIRHHILDERPMLYRVRAELMNGKTAYTGNVLLDGISVSPVQLYPTVITGNTVNVNAYWPVERIQVYASNGAQVYSQDVAGKRDYMAIVVPSLAKGMYWMTFYGRGWQTTEKFVVQ
ncbi:MAG TPA: T9SS type A sorting domain-containing protein [Chitinophagaceae bacterium]